MMKFVLLSLLLGVAHSADPVTVAKCITSPATGTDAPASKDCPANTANCFGPSYSLAAGIGASKYGCGACPSTEEGCVACATAGDDCNKVLTAREFECPLNEWKTDKFEAAKAATKCKGLEGVPGVCNGPTATAKEATYTAQNAGCGPCLKAQKDGKTCAETAGAAGLTAFLLPLLAAIYTLF